MEAIKRSTPLLKHKRAGCRRQTRLTGRSQALTDTPEKVINTCPLTGTPKTRAGSYTSMSSWFLTCVSVAASFGPDTIV